MRLKEKDIDWDFGGYGVFQFQTGAIKRRQRYRVLRQQYRFNSKLVRLKVSVGTAKLMPEIVFQFQTGAIKRLSEYCINIITDPYSSCQVNFYFDQIKGQSAVDL